MKRSSVGHLNCSIARSLDLVGEWWTLLIVRDVFLGARRFEQIRADLGISRNILTDRLGTLVEGGILERVPLETGHHEYRLTDKGVDLHRVLVALMQWGDRWESPEGPPMVLIHDGDHPTTPRLVCDHCGGEVTAHRTRAVPGPGYRADATAVADADDLGDR